MDPVTVEQFRGLRLLPEQGEAAGSVSMLNADLSRDFTQVASRGGMSLLGTGTASYHRIGALASGTILVVRNTGALASVQRVTISTGVFGASQTWGGASTYATAILPVDSNSVLLLSRSGVSNEAALVTSGGASMVQSYSPRYAAITAEGRRVIGHFTAAAGTPSGANGTPSTVFFSDADSPTTYGSSNWVQLDPFDGDEITGIVAWRDLLIVLKPSAMYVFLSSSIDATGNPIFNYRKITLPARARTTTNRGGENIVAGGDGVYLLLADGVYRTTGDLPQLISRDISPLFDGSGDTASLFPSSGDWTIGYAINRVYLSFQNGSAYRTLVFDCVLREWLLWDVSAGASAVPTNVIEWSDTNGPATAYVAAGAKVFSLTSTGTSDGGTAIVSSYQSGFDGLGSPSREKKIRNVEVVGTGTPTFTVLTDYATSDPLSRQGTVTLGTAPAIDTAVHSKAYRGRLVSYKLSATSGAWTATRLTWNVQSVRPPGLRSA